jgi:DNA repair exonuclease SbcCD ATPase subunit
LFGGDLTSYSFQQQLQKMKKELDRTKTELAKFRPDGSLDLITDEDEEEKLKKQLAQQQEVIDALDAQLKSLRGQLSSLYSAHIGSTAGDNASGKEQRQGTFKVSTARVTRSAKLILARTPSPSKRRRCGG